MEGRSAKIEDAAKRGRVFQKCEVWMKDHAGRMQKYKLSNVHIMNYSAVFTNGKPPIENFTLVYQNRTKI
jgi:type VI protein secretion system component Hcp